MPEKIHALSVAKVTVAFHGIESRSPSKNNRFSKMEALAKARQLRLSERTGNPLVEYLKKREEMNNITKLEVTNFKDLSKEKETK